MPTSARYTAGCCTRGLDGVLRSVVVLAGESSSGSPRPRREDSAHRRRSARPVGAPPDNLLDVAADVLERFAGLSPADARRLAEAARDAGASEALETIGGSNPMPSAIADARALRLRHITELYGRTLRPREVEVVLRVTPATAASTERRMRATYAGALDAYMHTLVRESATVAKIGSLDDPSGLRYEVSFDEPGALDYAIQLLQRAGLTRGLRVVRASQMLQVPRKVIDRAAVERDPLTALGLQVR
jgi:hypothetical protein